MDLICNQIVTLAISHMDLNCNQIITLVILSFQWNTRIWKSRLSSSTGIRKWEAEGIFPRRKETSRHQRPMKKKKQTLLQFTVCSVGWKLNHMSVPELIIQTHGDPSWSPQDGIRYIQKRGMGLKTNWGPSWSRVRYRKRKNGSEDKLLRTLILAHTSWWGRRSSVTCWTSANNCFCKSCTPSISENTCSSQSCAQQEEQLCSSFSCYLSPPGVIFWWV